MKISTFALVSLLFTSATALGAECTYRLDPQSVQVNWTAFKTTQKVPVKGSFTEVTLFGDLSGKGPWAKWLSELEGEITVSSEALIRTGNPGRDLTLFQHFFSKFKGRSRMHARIKDLKGDDQTGQFQLGLSMNGKTRALPMNYGVKDGVFEASGSFDLLQFALEDAFQDLHKTCEALHTGSDGVSKTWSQVDLKLVARIARDCGK